MSADPVALARQWAHELPVECARRLAAALRDGPEAVRALHREATLPLSTSAAARALDLVQTVWVPRTPSAQLRRPSGTEPPWV